MLPFHTPSTQIHYLIVQMQVIKHYLLHRTTTTASWNRWRSANRPHGFDMNWYCNSVRRPPTWSGDVIQIETVGMATQDKQAMWRAWYKSEESKDSRLKINCKIYGKMPRKQYSTEDEKWRKYITYIGMYNIIVKETYITTFILKTVLIL